MFEVNKRDTKTTVMAVNYCILHLCPEEKKRYERVAALHLFSKIDRIIAQIVRKNKFFSKNCKNFSRNFNMADTYHF